jgi:N-acetylmuramoyl-L-alanine amidase
MKISRHRLDPDEFDFVKSTKSSGTFAEGLPDTIIIHYTAGGSAESAINTFTVSDISASAHIVVARNGAITQLVPFNTIAWHAGRSAYGDRIGFNKYAIGIEIVNAGRLIKSGDKYVAWFGKSYPEDEVIEAIHRNEELPTFWHRYSEEQISAVYELCSDLIEKYNIKHILGHEEISPSRKIDPGPTFPLDKLRNRLFFGDRSGTQQEELELQTEAYQNPATVTASMLNIRSGPSASNPTIANPLTRNNKVNIIGESNGWLQVETKVRGWVHGGFVEREN